MSGIHPTNTFQWMHKSSSFFLYVAICVRTSSSWSRSAYVAICVRASSPTPSKMVILVYRNKG